MTGPDPSVVADLARRARAAGPRLGAVRLVLVDGPTGSGKTTLAVALSAALGGAPVVHLDDLYEGWSGLAEPLWTRLRGWVLEPLAAGSPGRYRRYDWATGAFGGWQDVPVTPVLVVEGVGAAAAPVADLATLTIWVEAPGADPLARAVARDGPGLREHLAAWQRAEAAHFAADGTRARADVAVDGSG